MIAPVLKLALAPLMLIGDMITAITTTLSGGWETLSGWGKVLTVIGGVLTAVLLPSVLSLAWGLLTSAVSAIWAGLSLIPFGLGIPIAIAAAAGLVGMFTGMLGNVKSTGDLAMSSNGGPIVASPREGTIFQGTNNDEVAMGPGVIGAARSGGGGGGDSSAVVAALNKQNLLLQQIASAISNPPPVQIGPKVISELSSVMEVERSYRS
jgi:hypothetical protein